MKKIVLIYDPGIVYSKVRITFKPELLIVETKKPMQFDDVEVRTEVDENTYLYLREIPITKSLVEIKHQFENIDFSNLYLEPQEFSSRRKYSKLTISTGAFDSISLKIKGINCITSHEGLRLQKILIKLFSEINMEDRYVLR